MEILFLLFLAHFIGDFPFQTSWVYAQKTKSLFGGLFHSLGIFFALLICLFPYLIHLIVWQVIGLIVLTHYIQDAGKLIFNKTFSREILGYFLDQGTHLFFSFLYWFLFLSEKNLELFFGAPVYKDLNVILYFIGLVWITYFLQVTIYVITNAQSRHKTPLKRDWKEMALNMTTYSLIFWGVVFFVL